MTVAELVVQQQTEEFVRQALDELELTYVDEIPEDLVDYFVQRSKALQEESA